MAFKFEELKVWQKAIDYTSDIHDLTRTFPKDELYILTAQIKRAAGLYCAQYSRRFYRSV